MFETIQNQKLQAPNLKMVEETLSFPNLYKVKKIRIVKIADETRPDRMLFFKTLSPKDNMEDDSIHQIYKLKHLSTNDFSITIHFLILLFQ